MAGLDVQKAVQIGGLDFHVLNLHGVAPTWKWLAYKMLTRLTRIGWKMPFSLQRTQFWSSGIGVSALRP